MLEYVKLDQTRTLKEAFDELNEICNDKLRVDDELKLTQRLKKYVHEYAKHIRTGVIAKLLEKDKGDIIHWYEIVKEVKTNKKGRQRIVKGYSTTSENVNMTLYKKFLTSKLIDTLEIVGIT